MLADRQPDKGMYRHADTLIAIHCSPTGGGGQILTLQVMRWLNLDVCSGEDGDDVGGKRAQFQQPAGPLSSRHRTPPGQPKPVQRRLPAAARPAAALRRRRGPRGMRRRRRRRGAAGDGAAAVPARPTPRQRRAQVLAAVRRQLLAALRLGRRLSANIDPGGRPRGRHAAV